MREAAKEDTFARSCVCVCGNPEMWIFFATVNCPERNCMVFGELLNLYTPNTIHAYIESCKSIWFALNTIKMSDDFKRISHNLHSIFFFFKKSCISACICMDGARFQIILFVLSCIIITIRKCQRCMFRVVSKYF